MSTAFTIARDAFAVIGAASVTFSAWTLARPASMSRQVRRLRDYFSRGSER